MWVRYVGQGVGRVPFASRLRTWRGHSCLQRRHSCRRSLVGHASACPVERSSTCSRVFLRLRRFQRRRTRSRREPGVSSARPGLWPFVRQAILPAGGLSGRRSRHATNFPCFAVSMPEARKTPSCRSSCARLDKLKHVLPKQERRQECRRCRHECPRHVPRPSLTVPLSVLTAP